MTFSKALAAVKQLPTRLVDAENSLMRVLSLTGELVRSVDGLRRNVEPTFVYVLPPSSGSGPMSAKSVSIPKGTSCRIDFHMPTQLPAGCWIVAVGPATVRSVRIGNQAQESMFDYNGHVCQTRDPLEVGAVLGVQLDG